jgi:CarD family transcriptional regulator
MMFQIGDTVIHPGYGAGTVVDIGKLHCLGGGKPYYSIELADGSKTRVWVPVRDADKRGVRHPTPASQLIQIWRVLSAGPEPMSPDHDERSGCLQAKLRVGDAESVAEVVRDMFWASHRSRRLTILDKELYDRGLALLSSEVAVVQGCDLAAAEETISGVLAASLAAQPAV